MDAQTANPLTEAGGQALTLHQALGSLMPAPEPEPAAPPERPQQNPAPEADAAPAEQEQPSGETEAQPEPEEEQLPPIEAPRFWKKAAREHFESLPRPIQEMILERETERDTEVRRLQNETAEKRKTFESEALAAQNERQRYQQQLQPLIQGLQQSLQSEFADIKTPGDVVALAQSDPARYALWRARMDAIQYGQAQLRQIQEAQTAEQRKQYEEYARAEWNEYLKHRPEYKDRSRWEAARRELRDYAVSLGYSEQDFDSNVAHRHLLVLEKAMLYDRAQKAKAEAVAKPVPKVQQPGTARTRADKAADERAARLKKLEQSGSIEDAMGLLRR